jgi:hypothetical protein
MSTISAKNTKTTMIGVRSLSFLPIFTRKTRSKVLYVSRFSTVIEKSLKKQLKLSSLVCTWLKIESDSYASFQVSVFEDDFNIINNTVFLPNGCLIANFYGRLNAEQIYSVENTVLPSAAETTKQTGDIVLTSNFNMVSRGSSDSIH